jgi:hypothetical protein
MAGTFTGTASLSGTFRPDAGSIVNESISASANIARSKLAQDAAAEYVVPWSAFRVHDAIQTLLPSPAANDDLGFPATQTMGTVTPYLETADKKAAGATTIYARFQFALPPEYDSEETITLRLRGGMKTTVADTTATIDAEVYKSDEDGGVSGGDICDTAAQSINNLTAADKDFTITATGLAAGDVLDIRVMIAINDAATGTAVIGRLNKASLLLDIRG